MSSALARGMDALKGTRPLQSHFFRNVLSLFAGSATAQALTMLAYPILTRLYAPHDMGIVSAIIAATVIVSPTVAGGYEMALPLARSEAEAGNLIAVCTVALGITVALATAILALLPASVLMNSLGVVGPYRYFLPLGMLTFGGYVILVYEATRLSRFSDIARTRVYQAVGGPIVQIGLGFAGVGPIGLLAGFIVGQSSGTLGLARRLILGPNSPLRHVTPAAMAAAAKHFRRFPLFASWSNLISAAAQNMMNLLFTILYGATIGGFLFLGDRVLVRPLFLITASILQVFIGEAARKMTDDPASMKALFLDIIGKQAVISALWIGAIIALAPIAIPIAFGAKWAPAASYLQVLAIGYFPASVLHPVLHTLQIIGRQKLAAALDTGRFAAMLAALAIAYSLHVSPLHALLACSAAQAVCHCLSLAMIYRSLNRMTNAVPHK